MSDREEVTAAIEAVLGLVPSWSKDGCPSLDSNSLREIRWPKKLIPEWTAVLDPSPGLNGETWPDPRFEILIANLDAIGIKSVQCGGEEFVKLSRVERRFTKFNALERAALISNARLWIGIESSWRWIAAAVGTPQVVISSNLLPSPRLWPTTFSVKSGKHAPESKILGPISVTDVAEAAMLALKFKRAGAQV